tara:strand:- start:202 stop:1608 length:1407 start_codon:yes stop_codon:yes gene_type:complete
MATTLEIKYFNTFLLKKIKNVVDQTIKAGYPGPAVAIPPYENVPASFADDETNDWYIEESRIRGGYNNTPVDLGVKAYLDEENPLQQHRFNTMIYSGIFNSRTGVNNTNQFSIGEDITRSADPANGSIQKLYAEDTNLIIFQEDKVSRALIDKDAIYSAEGNASITSTKLVIGQIVAYAGEYGISEDPFSFAVYGYRKYFTDRKRNCVMRLSAMPGGGGNGLTEISSYGMHDFFRDELSASDLGIIRGGWDIHTKNYVVSMQKTTGSDENSYKTVSFDETVKGWTSFYSYKPVFINSIGSSFYSFNEAILYEHYNSLANYGHFYTTTYDSTVELLLNLDPSIVKNFKTINYEGSDGWQLQSMIASSTDASLPITKWVPVYNLNNLEFNLFATSFSKKENKFFANLQQQLSIGEGGTLAGQTGEVLWGSSVSGLKGFFATVKMQLINSDYPTTKKELFTVSSDVVRSSS